MPIISLILGVLIGVFFTKYFTRKINYKKYGTKLYAIVDPKGYIINDTIRIYKENSWRQLLPNISNEFHLRNILQLQEKGYKCVEGFFAVSDELNKDILGTDENNNTQTSIADDFLTRVCLVKDAESSALYYIINTAKDDNEVWNKFYKFANENGLKANGHYDWKSYYKLEWVSMTQNQIKQIKQDIEAVN